MPGISPTPSSTARENSYLAAKARGSINSVQAPHSKIVNQPVRAPTTQSSIVSSDGENEIEKFAVNLHHFNFKLKKLKTKFKNRNFKFKNLKTKFKNRNFKLKKVKSKFKKRNFNLKIKLNCKFESFLLTQILYISIEINYFMVLEHKFCIQKWKFFILCSNTYYKRPEVQADKGNLFTFSMSI